MIGLVSEMGGPRVMDMDIWAASFPRSAMPYPIVLQIEVEVDKGVERDVTASRSERYWGEWRTWQEARSARIEEVCGKYKSVLTPSDEFAQQKRVEMDLEE
jgi:hypothetical protein